MPDQAHSDQANSDTTSGKPNILWFSFEDTTPRFGCYGDELARTPNVDRVAAEGRRYPNAFCTAPVCAPSRFAVITGLYASACGAHHMRTMGTAYNDVGIPTPYSTLLPHYARCFTEYLRAAGYYCTNNSKTDYQFDPPLTAWDDCSNRGHWRHRPNPDQPFFAVFNDTLTHESGQWDEKGGEPTTDPGAVALPPYLPDTPDCRKALARQYDHIATVDAHLGRRLTELEEDGLLEHTVVMIWSDHGEGLPRSKRWPYDSGLRVPCIVRVGESVACEGLKRGTVDDRLVSMIDLGPTVLSLAGLDVPRHMQGQPFLDRATDPPAREYVYATRDRYDTTYDMVRAVRDGRFKYIRNFAPHLPRLLWVPYRNKHPIMKEIWKRYAAGTLEGPQQWFAETPRPCEELYDTEADPHEMSNLADNPAFAHDLTRLREALADWRAAVGDLGEVDEVVMKRWWWPDGDEPQAQPVMFVPLGEHHHGRSDDGCPGELVGPVVLQLHTPTQGASIAYTFEPGDEAHWLLYHEPIALPAGTTTVRAKAIRVGYAESDEASATFNVT